MAQEKHIDILSSSASAQASTHSTLLERALFQSEERFRAVAESAIDAIISANSSSEIIYFNQSALRMFGYSAEELLHKPLTILMPKEFHAAHKVGLERFLNTGESTIIGKTIEVIGKRKDSTEFPLEISLASWTVDEVVCFTAILRDITDRKEAEENASRLALLHQREDFMFTLTHDLKNPLIGANRIIDSLLDGHLGDLATDQLAVLRQLQESNMRVIDRIQNLIEIYRYGKYIHTLTFVETLVAELLRGCILQLHPLAQTHGIKIALNITNDKAKVLAEPASLERVFHNILDNAIRFTPDGGEIRANLVIGGTNVIVTIEDTGPGINPTDRERLFNRFWQGMPGQKYVAGTGLGLYLCKQIVDAHNGEITCESLQGKGAAFTISLPLVASRKHRQRL